VEQKLVTYDFRRHATKVKICEFGDYVIGNMDVATRAVRPKLRDGEGGSDERM
jgi:hypothetical protein